MALHNLKIIVYDGGKTRDGIFGSDDSKESGDSKKQEKSLLYKVLNYAILRAECVCGGNFGKHVHKAISYSNERISRRERRSVVRARYAFIENEATA